MGAWIEIDKEIYNLGFDESLPLWERGLKLLVSICVNFNVMSLPLWERGLKFYTKEKNKLNAWSLPLWERGLKSQTPQTMQTPQTVAPLVGAWIEISLNQLSDA